MAFVGKNQSSPVGVGRVIVTHEFAGSNPASGIGDKMNEMCSHYGKKTEVTVQAGVAPAPVAKRVKCPECGRKVKQRIVPCTCGFDDACEFTISIPPHKVKGWFKKEKTKKKHKETTGIRATR